MVGVNGYEVHAVPVYESALGFDGVRSAFVAKQSRHLSDWILRTASGKHFVKPGAKTCQSLQALSSASSSSSSMRAEQRKPFRSLCVYTRKAHSANVGTRLLVKKQERLS